VTETTHPHPHRQRLDQLLADRALFGLSSEEHSELDTLTSRFPSTDADCFDRVAASVLLANLSRHIYPMSASLQARVRQQALTELATDHAPKQEVSAAQIDLSSGRWRTGFREVIAWTLAAAAIAAAVLLWCFPRSSADKAASVAELRRQAIRDSEHFARMNWQKTGDSAAETATGDVVWSNAGQQGYMRFRDLQRNNPALYQYQLWIFDAERDDRYPIDGGVFDICDDQGETIVPIRAKLRVRCPLMFAVTVEKPGGVVVSNRERICLVAKFDE
jgi:hypothetical protein